MSSEVDWTGITIDNGQCEYPDCPFCAMVWLRWWAARQRQMEIPRKNKGETVSFAEATATSVRSE